MSSVEFRVPLAHSVSGELISPAVAEKGAPYACPHCKADLIFRKGEVRRPHFAHRAVSMDVCSPDLVERHTAKQLVVNAVRAWRNGDGPRPIIARECSGCGRPTETNLGENVTDAQVDHQFTFREFNSVIDVALLAGSRVVAVLDLRGTLSRAANQVATMEMPWLELDPRRTARKPTTWKPTAHGRLKRVTCARCSERGRARSGTLTSTPNRQLSLLGIAASPTTNISLGSREILAALAARQERRRKRKLRFFAHRQGVRLPVVGYLEYLKRCDNCHRWVLFFRPMPTSGGIPRMNPPQGAPTRSTGPYQWSNVCCYCNTADSMGYLLPKDQKARTNQLSGPPNF